MKDYILSGNIPIYYKKNDFKSNRKTLVFIHGLSGSSGAWIPYEKKFEKNYNILSFDLRGHGKSFKPKKYEDYSISLFVYDFYRLLRHLKIKKFVMISHSFAAMIAMEFLKKHQNMVEKAVFLSPLYTSPTGKFPSFVKSLLKITKPLWPKIPNRIGWHVDYRNYPNTGDWNIPRMIQDVGSTSLAVYLTCSLQSYNFNAKNFLEKIKIPVLLVHGKKDTIFPHENAIYMNKKIKNSKLILLENTDHIIVLNNVREVCELMEKFLKN